MGKGGRLSWDAGGKGHAPLLEGDRLDQLYFVSGKETKDLVE